MILIIDSNAPYISTTSVIRFTHNIVFTAHCVMYNSHIRYKPSANQEADFTQAGLTLGIAVTGLLLIYAIFQTLYGRLPGESR